MEYHPIFAADTAVHSTTPFVLPSHARPGHLLISGNSPAAKVDLQWNLILQDIEAGCGVVVIDTTGQFARPLLDAIPPERAHDTYYVNPASEQIAVGYNPLWGVPENQRAKATQDIVAVFAAIWQLDYDRTPLLLDILRSSIRVLLDWPEATMLALVPFLTNPEFRQRVVRFCNDPIARPFWEDFEKRPAREKRDIPQSVLTRVRSFLSDPALRCMLGQIKGQLDVGRLVRSGQVFLLDIPERDLGRDTSRFIGSLLTTHVARAVAIEDLAKPHYTYILNSHRLYPQVCTKLFDNPQIDGGSILSVEHVSSFDTDVRNALLQAETLISFRQPADDVRHLAARFPVAQPEETLQTLQPDRLVVTTHQYELACRASPTTLATAPDDRAPIKAGFSQVQTHSRTAG